MADSDLNEILQENFKAFRIAHDARILQKFVIKEGAKGLSEENFTPAEKNKLAALPSSFDTSDFVTNAALSSALADIPTVDTSDFVTNAALSSALEGITPTTFAKVKGVDGHWYRVPAQPANFIDGLTFRGYVFDGFDADNNTLTVYEALDSNAPTTTITATLGDVIFLASEENYYLWTNAVPLDGTPIWVTDKWRELPDGFNPQDFTSFNELGKVSEDSVFDTDSANVYIKGVGNVTANIADVVVTERLTDSTEETVPAYFFWTGSLWELLAYEDA